MPTIIIKQCEPVQINPLVGHIIIMGKSGSGKSNTAEFICTNMLERGGVKIVDVYDNGRFENMMYGFEEDNPYLVKKTYNLIRKKPKSFPNQIIAIPGSDLRDNPMLPKNIQLMSFDIKDLDLDDLFYLLGSTDKLLGFLASVSNRFGDTVNMEVLYDMILGKRPGAKVPENMREMVIRNIRRWLNSGMFSNEVPKIKFEEILNDTSTITSFSTFLMDNEESQRIAYGLILKKINDLKRRRKVHNRILVYTREMSVFFNSEWGMARKYLLEYLRQGRDRGIDLICDMQRGQDIDSKFRRQFGIQIQLRSDTKDAEGLLDFQGDIPRQYFEKAPQWGAGEGIILTGSSWEYPFLVPPTYHKHKHPTMTPLQLMADKYGVREFTPEEVEKILHYENSPVQDQYEEEQEEENAIPKPKIKLFERKAKGAKT